MARSLLILCRQAPWAGLAAREALDIALAGGAFELPVALAFIDDGVFQLAPGQQPALLDQKDLSANLKALPLFGIEALYACQASLAARGIEAGALAVPAQVLDRAALARLIDGHDQVMTL